MTETELVCDMCSREVREEDANYYDEVDQVLCDSCADQSDATYDAWKEDQLGEEA